MNFFPNKLTLKESLALLVEKHTLSEVLDRLAEFADSNAQVSEADAASEWNHLVKVLEGATHQAKILESRADTIERDFSN